MNLGVSTFAEGTCGSRRSMQGHELEPSYQDGIEEYLYISLFLSSLVPNSIPLYDCIILCLYFHQLMGIWMVSTF